MRLPFQKERCGQSLNGLQMVSPKFILWLLNGLFRPWGDLLNLLSRKPGGMGDLYSRQDESFASWAAHYSQIPTSNLFLQDCLEEKGGRGVDSPGILKKDERLEAFALF